MASMGRIASNCAPMLQTARDIIKKFLSRDVVLQFTAVKNTGKKFVLSKTQFFSCVQGKCIEHLLYVLDLNTFKDAF